MKRHLFILIALVIAMAACSAGETQQEHATESIVSHFVSSQVSEFEPESESVSVPVLEAESDSEPEPEPPTSQVNGANSASTVQNTYPDGYSTIPSLSNIQSLYALKPPGYSYIGIWEAYSDSFPVEFRQSLIGGLALFEGLEPLEANKEAAESEFLIWTRDGIRYSVGIAQGGYLVVNGKAYILPQNREKEIQLFHQYILDTIDNNPYEDIITPLSFAFPRWLTWMTPSKIEEVIYHSPENGACVFPQDTMLYAANYVRISVDHNIGSTYNLGTQDFSGSDVFHLEIRFAGDITYDIYAREKDYYIESSAMPYGIKYKATLDSHGALIMQWIYEGLVVDGVVANTNT